MADLRINHATGWCQLRTSDYYPWLTTFFRGGRDDGTSPRIPGVSWEKPWRKFPINLLPVVEGLLRSKGVHLEVEEDHERHLFSAFAPRVIKSAQGWTPRTWQTESLPGMWSGNYLLLHPPGGRKTTTALAAMLGLDMPMLVACPAHIRLVWRDQAVKWFGLSGDDIRIIDNGKQASSGAYDRQLTIVSYHLLDKVAQGWPLVFFDEVHELKTPTTKRYKAAERLIQRGCKRVWGGSGTVIPNHTAELYPVLELVQKGLWGKTHWDFERRYSGLHKEQAGDKTFHVTRGVGDYASYEEAAADMHLDELRMRLLTVADVRSPDEIEAELPALSIEVTHVEPPFGEEGEELRRAERTYRQVGSASSWQRYLEASTRAREPVVVQLLQDALMTDTWVLVLTYRKALAHSLATAAGRMAGVYVGPVLTGDVQAGKRHGLIEQMRALAGSTTKGVVVASQDCVTTGIDLTFCSRVIFAEPDYVPGDMEQRIKRVHRQNQTRPVCVTLIAVDGSVDDQILEALNMKALEIGGVLPQSAVARGMRQAISQGVESDDVFRRVLEKVR